MVLLKAILIPIGETYRIRTGEAGVL